MVAALRAQLGAKLTAVSSASSPLAPAARPLVSLGDDALDAALPAGGLEAGALHAAQAQTYLDQPAAMGLLLAFAARALAARPGALVWVRGPKATDFGAPYGPGLAGFGAASPRTLHVRAATFKDALWSAEEALRSAGAAAVLLEAGAGLSITAARRLQLAAEAGGGLGLALGASLGARTRWTVTAAPSAAPDWAQGQGLPAILVPPGAARWTARMSAGGRPERALVLEWRHETHRFHSVAALADTAVLPSSTPVRRSAAG